MVGGEVQQQQKIHGQRVSQKKVLNTENIPAKKKKKCAARNFHPPPPHIISKGQSQKQQILQSRSYTGPRNATLLF